MLNLINKEYTLNSCPMVDVKGSVVISTVSCFTLRFRKRCLFRSVASGQDMYFHTDFHIVSCGGSEPQYLNGNLCSKLYNLK